MPRSSLRACLSTLWRPNTPVSRGAAPSVPARYLTGLVFPATTTSLVAALERNDAPAPFVDRARRFPSRVFASGEEVVAAFREQ
jgi:hypothetical protein